MSMHRYYSPLRSPALLAILLLSLSAALWLQGQHFHLQEQGLVHDCAVCHLGVAGAVGAAPQSFAPPRSADGRWLRALLPSCCSPSLVLPPSRASPIPA